MFGDIEAVSYIEGQNEKIAGILNELSSVFNGSGINPGSEIEGSQESGLSIGGGTFVTENKVHAELASKLDSIYSGSAEQFIEGGNNMSKEVGVLSAMGKGLQGAKAEIDNMSLAIQERITLVNGLKEYIHKGFEKLYDIASKDQEDQTATRALKEVQDKLFDELDRQIKSLHNLLKIKVQPIENDIVDFLKKNQDFTKLAETLGVQYGNEEASDRLAIVFTNMSELGLLSKKINNALKEIKLSIEEYKKIKNMDDLNDKILKIFKSLNKEEMKEKLPNILDAIKLLQNNQTIHSDIVKCLESKDCMIKTQIKAAGEHELSDSDSESSSDEEEVSGGDYKMEVGRSKKASLKSSLSKRLQTYQKSLKELYKNFMRQINSQFKEMGVLIDLLSQEIGSNISYDEDLQKFIEMFKGFNEDIDNEKIFYSLIDLDNSVAGTALKTRFNDNLDKIIKACEGLHNYKIFKDLTNVLKKLKELIDIFADTVNKIKKVESEKQGAADTAGSSEFVWTDKLVEQSFSMNNIKLIKNSIKKLAFYGKISMIKDNLNRMNKEQKLYQEDYNKLLGKSIGLKLNEINREYVENLDRLKDKTRGRGKLLEEFNKGKADNQKLPRGLIENIYKLQYEAKSGLYRTLESIDLYLMNFTENLTAHPEAVMELNQMLEQTNIIAKWFTQKSVDNITELLDSNIKSDSTEPDNLKDFMETYNIPSFLQNEPLNKATGNVADRIRAAYEQTKKSIDSISVLKNIISMFVHIGENYGKINLTDKLYMSPNMIYKNLVKYIWVSAFTMGYGTGGGDYSSPNNDATSKGQYEPEKGDFDSFFNILFTTVIMPLDLFKEVETIVQQDISNLSKNTNAPAYDALQNIKKRLQKDIFVIDDKYFILALKSMVGKIFTVIDTHSLLKTPDTLANIMKNPVRMIIGAAEPDVIPEAIELYVRLPLLVEFYKQIFEDGNRKYKNNEDKDNELEIIAYIPELGTVWSGLIQCIFDDSKYIKDGLYSINNIKDIINEVNKIYNSYKNKTDKDKIVRTIVLDLIAEINRRYGILKKKDIAEFYQVKKKYIKNITDSKLEDNVSYDILDESVEYERAGPSSQYIEASFSKESDESLVFSDIKLVRDFRNNIYNELFANDEEIKDLSNKSFKEKIKYYKRQIASSESKETKFELIASAIDQSSNINAYNTDVYILYYEFVISTMQDLEQLYNYIHTTNTRLGNIQTPLNLLVELYRSYNDGSIFKVKMITGNKFIIDYHSLQAHVESYIENIKYMISKFRNIICKDTIKDIENRLFELENLLLNIIIKDDQSAEQYAENKDITFESVNQQNIAKLSNLDVNLSDLYKHILFTSSSFDDVASPVKNNSQLLMDVHQKYDATRRSWELKNTIRYYNYITPLNNIENNDSFKNKSIVQKFNMLLFAYLNQFYNSSTKKFYGKLIDEFANKTSSAAIFELGGIPDLVDINNNPNVEPSAFNTNFALVNTNIPLSMTNVVILRTLLTRTLNVQLPVKYHLVDNLAEVSSVQLEKYRAYLPVFVTYFEHLIEECNMYKQLLDNNSVNIANFTNEPTAPTNNINISLFDDAGKPISYTTKFADQTNADVDTYKRSFHEMLNNVINSARSLINDASNVLIELNYVPQYGNIRENFIKNFYNNNKELPFMPVSMMNFQSKSMLPIYPINSDEYKFIYGTNYVYNNKNANKSEDVNNYLWLKEQVKAYNNSALSTNVLDVKQINAVLTSKYHFNHFYNLSNNVKNNLYYRSWADDDNAVENKYSDIMNINIYNNNNLNTLVNLMENKLHESKKSQLIKSILDNCGAIDPALNNYNLDRKKARILNIIDLNVNPINIHALMREVPLVNIYNYAFTFDNIVKSFIYNINPDELYKQANLISGDKAPLALLSCLLQDPYVINYKSVDKTSANPLLDSLNKILTISYQPTEYKQQNTLYLAPPKYTTNLFESLSNSASSKISTNPTLYHNNKFLRNILFLVNLQRVIRLKIKSAVYRINSNIVSDTNILNMRITDYTVPNDTSIKEDEFEISDLL
jgi:hypothetical protein